ncbi:hypothetical protein BCR33DRAFT_234798 [Rhizoclosmatium globosum]|uniref:Uncharacterized protein n=1 Tax=Rhizoclosmatium globosum TaxID=329046 RepID=A0A1Y2CAM0_9FUNG|nr:hypothetical protein BCR33DRAFT_234798 [Rhizoclosmatium globosum]|eukprot:ORY44083.1 hypothetical protein BCR33DRAFT_234798 [Rhizoclosmatium globosum]
MLSATPTLDVSPAYSQLQELSDEATDFFTTRRHFFFFHHDSTSVAIMLCLVTWCCEYGPLVVPLLHYDGTEEFELETLGKLNLLSLRTSASIERKLVVALVMSCVVLTSTYSLFCCFFLSSSPYLVSQ